ncbi:MAG: hypothetical protein GY758_25205 [Fuerstiella sp.]|nr:hypothetical protein [Fuerstiella sp.]MCP4511456.1 hypothetical protein [Fuerstiella sp.]MDG2128420.1 hypothetical protein [Fuerstiella sp.]
MLIPLRVVLISFAAAFSDNSLRQSFVTLATVAAEVPGLQHDAVSSGVVPQHLRYLGIRLDAGPRQDCT